jgi:L-arabinose isomerase
MTMSISSASSSSVASSVKLDCKTVHKEEITKLSQEVKSVIQSASRKAKIIENPKTSSCMLRGHREEVGNIADGLKALIKKVVGLEAKLESTSYKHASFKSKDLNGLKNSLSSSLEKLTGRSEVSRKAEEYKFHRAEEHAKTKEQTREQKNAKQEEMRRGNYEFNGGMVR